MSPHLDHWFDEARSRFWRQEGEQLSLQHTPGRAGDYETEVSYYSSPIADDSDTTMMIDVSMASVENDIENVSPFGSMDTPTALRMGLSGSYIAINREGRPSTGSMRDAEVAGGYARQRPVPLRDVTNSFYKTPERVNRFSSIEGHRSHLSSGSSIGSSVATSEISPSSGFARRMRAI